MKTWLVGIHELSEEQMLKVKETGLRHRTVYSRISAGWDIDKAVSTPPLYETQVSKFYTKEDILEAKKNGINRTTFIARLTKLKGWTLEEAKTLPASPGRRRSNG